MDAERGIPVWQDPAFSVYLLAVGLLPFRWLSPIGGLEQNSEWSDLLFAVATVLWAADHLRLGQLANVRRRWQVPLAVYLLLACVSAVFAVPGFGGSFKDVLLMLELGFIAVLTSDFASDFRRRRLIARTVATSALVTIVLGAAGLILFYAGVRSGLTGVYGEQLTPSSVFTRIRAGVQTPPLLASYCIFASGIAASADAALGRRLRLTCQVGLFLLCAATVSRGLIGFVLALVIRGAAKLRPARRRAVVALATLTALGVIAFLTVGRFHVDLHARSQITYSVPDPGNRREAFSTSLHTLEHHPLTGVGPGAFPGINAGQPFRAHFTPLNIAATLGLPALVSFLAMLWLLWRDRRRPTELAYWSALAGLAVDGLAQDVDHFRHIWLMLGLVGRNHPSGGEVAQDQPSALRHDALSPTSSGAAPSGSPS